MGKSKSGYRIDVDGVGVHYYESVTRDEAEKRTEAMAQMFVVETVNTAHLELKKYFANSLPEAAACAAYLHASFEDVTEYVTAIRPATNVEAQEFGRALAEIRKRAQQVALTL